MILLVTYDLKGPAGSYNAFYEVLKSQGPWWHYLTNTWLVSTSKTPQQLYESLAPYLNIPAGDRILISPLEKYWGLLPRKAWDWIQQQK
jgi:hypothetical protein